MEHFNPNSPRNDSQAYFDSALGAVINSFPTFLSNEAFIQRCEQSLQLLQEHNCSRLLVDTSSLGVMGFEKKSYIERTWFPKALEIGLKTAAFLVPKDNFGKYGMEQANKKAAEEMPINMRYFHQFEEARLWLVHT
jgi:hypothetical protein